MSTRARITGMAVGLVLAVMVAGAAYAGNDGPQGMSQQAYQALMLRSQALNILYGLGKPVGMTTAEYRAMLIRGAALNEQYGLPVALGPNEITRQFGSRAGEIRPPVRTSTPTVATAAAGGFDWTNALLGGAIVAGLIALVAAAVVTVQQRGHTGHPRPH